jgi:hypothetical protein
MMPWSNGEEKLKVNSRDRKSKNPPVVVGG